MVCITPLNLLSSFMLIQMLTGQVIRLIDVLSQVFVSCQVLLLSRGAARSRMWFLVLVLRLSIVPLLTPLASLFGFAGSWLTWMLHSPLPLLFIVTIVVLFTLLIMMSSTNAPSILRLTATSLASILRKEISSYSPSPLLTSLLISLPRLTRLVIFEILYPNSNWLPPFHLEFEGRYQCIAQTSLAHWAQPSILYLWFTHFTCTAHIPSLYKTLYCTLLYTHQYTDYSVFLSYFILLTFTMFGIYFSHNFLYLVASSLFSSLLFVRNIFLLLCIIVQTYNVIHFLMVNSSFLFLYSFSFFLKLQA